MDCRIGFWDRLPERPTGIKVVKKSRSVEDFAQEKQFYVDIMKIVPESRAVRTLSNGVQLHGLEALYGAFNTWTECIERQGFITPGGYFLSYYNLEKQGIVVKDICKKIVSSIAVGFYEGPYDLRAEMMERPLIETVRRQGVRYYLHKSFVMGRYYYCVTINKNQCTDDGGSICGNSSDLKSVEIAMKMTKQRILR